MSAGAGSAAREVMLDTLENDVATSVAILDRLPAAERPAWIGPLQRANYGYAIGEGRAGSNELSERAQVIAAKIRAADAAPNAASATTDSANTFLPGH
nr:hypothetical protein [Herbaspirillum sp. ASV7]